MKNFVDGIDWVNAEAMKYWAAPASYSAEKKRTEVSNAVFGGRYLGALKVDGYYQRLVKDEDGNCFMIARSKNVKKEAVDKYEWVPQLHSFMESLPNGTVLLCECYLPGQEGSKNITTLLGCLKEKCIERQNKNGKLHFYIFDICAWGGKNWIDVPAAKRFEWINSHKRFEDEFEFVEMATYYKGKELWDKLGEYLSSGREGMVITRDDCPIYFKRTPAHMTIKVKKEINQTIDCFFTGRATAPTMNYAGKEIETWKYWINQVSGERVEGEFFKEYSEGTPLIPVTKPYFYKWAGSLEIGVLKDGVTVPIGFLSGVTDEIKANPKDYAFKPIEVTCMEITQNASGEYGLRHAKMIGFREDLTIEECTWEKIFG